VPVFVARRVLHHHDIHHARTGERFEYDYWRPAVGIAVEVMGYRADDEIYKNILKLHVHDGTRLGIVLGPPWKGISGKRTKTNFKAAMMALALAESFMDVEALVAIAYDWLVDGAGWMLVLGPAREVAVAGRGPPPWRTMQRTDQ
jgi:hypothetical protein